MEAALVMEDKVSSPPGGKTAEGLFLSHFNSAIFGFAILDENLRYTYINDTLAQMNGLPAAEHLGKHLREVIPHLADHVEALCSEVFATGRPQRRTELCGETGTESGRNRHWVVDIFPMRDRNGKPDAVGVTVFETTSQKDAEDKLHNIVENIPGVVWEAYGAPHEAGQRIVYVSDYVEELLGYSVAEWLSTPNFWLTIVAPEDRERMTAESAQAFASGEGSRAEFRWLHKDGHRVWVEAQSTIITDDQGRPIGVRGVNIDITKRKLFEEQLHQSQKLEAIGLLAGGIAHDFNNLLTVINGYSDLAIAGLHTDDPLRHKLEEIKTAGGRAANLTRQLLIFSRKQVANPIVVDPNAAIRDLEKMLRRLIGENIEFKTLLEENIQRIKADRGQFEQVIMNLVVNARDAMPKGGKLTIETTQLSLGGKDSNPAGGCSAGPHVMIAVTDNGIGMDAQTRSRIFEPFFTTKELGKGTGLGLSTVYGIVQQAKGSISVESEMGRGTTFRIYLPALAENPQNLPASLVTNANRGNETILLVEDEEAVRAVARTVLEDLGYRVLTAGNAEDGLAIAETGRHQIDLLLTDIVLPKADGIYLSRLIKHDFPGIKVLYMSGYTDNALIHQGMRDGTVSYIQKPFDAASLAGKVREALARQGSDEVIVYIDLKT
jgi:two-component system cell cycle sensor histidine kinase/response regulator CckA